MRTTLAIDDAVLEQAKAIAHARKTTLGKVVSDLMRRGLELGIAERDGFPVFAVRGDVHQITAEAVRAAQDEE